jgi:hypothetical protein
MKLYCFARKTPRRGHACQPPIFRAVLSSLWQNYLPKNQDHPQRVPAQHPGILR